MTLLSRDDLLPKEKKATEPAKGWVNRWRAVNPWMAVCVVCDHRRLVRRGETATTHCRRYPSKDVAESHANELDAAQNNGDREYLGAFPIEGEGGE
jgi:hypothetical protein